jgi:hypothetical protein
MKTDPATGHSIDMYMLRRDGAGQRLCFLLYHILYQHRSGTCDRSDAQHAMLLAWLLQHRQARPMQCSEEEPRMARITTVGGANAALQLRDHLTGDEIQIDIGMYDSECILLHPIKGNRSLAEAKIVYTNHAVRLDLRDAVGKTFSITLWDYTGRDHHEAVEEPGDGEIANVAGNDGHVVQAVIGE